MTELDNETRSWLKEEVGPEEIEKSLNVKEWEPVDAYDAERLKPLKERFRKKMEKLFSDKEAKVYKFRSPEETWLNMCGREGYIAIKNEKVVDSVLTMMN